MPEKKKPIFSTESIKILTDGLQSLKDRFSKSKKPDYDVTESEASSSSRTIDDREDKKTWAELFGEQDKRFAEVSSTNRHRILPPLGTDNKNTFLHTENRVIAAMDEVPPRDSENLTLPRKKRGRKTNIYEDEDERPWKYHTREEQNDAKSPSGNEERSEIEDKMEEDDPIVLPSCIGSLYDVIMFLTELGKRAPENVPFIVYFMWMYKEHRKTLNSKLLELIYLNVAMVVVHIRERINSLHLHAQQKRKIHNRLVQSAPKQRYVEKRKLGDNELRIFKSIEENTEKWLEILNESTFDLGSTEFEKKWPPRDDPIESLNDLIFYDEKEIVLFYKQCEMNSFFTMWDKYCSPPHTQIPILLVLLRIFIVPEIYELGKIIDRTWIYTFSHKNRVDTSESPTQGFKISDTFNMLYAVVTNKKQMTLKQFRI